MNIVTPGELISEEQIKTNQGVFSRHGKFYSKFYGILNSRNDFTAVNALNGVYLPKREDVVICFVEDVKFSGVVADINSPYQAYMQTKDSRIRFEMHNVFAATVIDADSSQNILLDYPEKLTGGTVIRFPPLKIPRAIGRNASMVKMIKDLTGCKIIIGKNGRIWINGENQNLAKKAFEMISKQAHIPGLTERVRKSLEENNQN
ncbi:MAG: hypothetical protein J7K00_00255 [Candidatus Diapherotrites archaeon]|nr:hypothetical protein [Candidatus Diapherotrites archaeon]